VKFGVAIRGAAGSLIRRETTILSSDDSRLKRPNARPHPKPRLREKPPQKAQARTHHPAASRRRILPSKHGSKFVRSVWTPLGLRISPRCPTNLEDAPRQEKRGQLCCDVRLRFILALQCWTVRKSVAPPLIALSVPMPRGRALTLGHLYTAPLFKGILASRKFSSSAGWFSDSDLPGQGPGQDDVDPPTVCFLTTSQLLITESNRARLRDYKQLGLKTWAIASRASNPPPQCLHVGGLIVRQIRRNVASVLYVAYPHT